MSVPFLVPRAPLALALLVGVGGTLAGRVPSAFDERFAGRTLRVDYFHTGGPGTEVLSLDRLVADGPWAGRRVLGAEATLGSYRSRVIDAASGDELYARGFSSVFAEWETTPDAKAVHRTFHESVRVPWPTRPVRIALDKRQHDGRFREIWSLAIDEAALSAARPEVPLSGRVWTLAEHGPPADKVDLLLLAEGYAAGEQRKFRADAARMVEALFAVEPYKSRRHLFNIRAVDLVSRERGVTHPHRGVWRQTPLSAEFNIFGTDRYMLVTDNRALRDVAAHAPYDVIEVLVNEKTYGGGGIYNAHATVAVDGRDAEYVFVHEFAHHFAGLGDEYYGSLVAYETGVLNRPEPWEPNVTALHDPAALKWRDLVDAGTPLPTPWDQAGYKALSQTHSATRAQARMDGASEAAMAALQDREQEAHERFLSGLPWARKTGAFEGASYEEKGLFRPSLNCVMFTRTRAGFCRVCQRAIVRAIEQFAQ